MIPIVSRSAMPRVCVGEPIPPELLSAAGVNSIFSLIDELRAALEPLIDEPYEIVGWTSSDEPESACRFCYVSLDAANTHKPDCPVTRRDVLLGRP
jgi:hypothetical protein